MGLPGPGTRVNQLLLSQEASSAMGAVWTLSLTAAPLLPQRKQLNVFPGLLQTHTGQQNLKLP